MTNEQIIDCDGKYEVHPMTDGRWAVVNGYNGQVRTEHDERKEAVAAAEERNRATA